MGHSAPIARTATLTTTLAYGESSNLLQTAGVRDETCGIRDEACPAAVAG